MPCRTFADSRAARINSIGGFDEPTLCHLDRDQVEAIIEFASTLMMGFQRSDQRAIFLNALCDQLAMMQVDKLDRSRLAQLFPLLKRYVESTTIAAVEAPGRAQRMAFRTLLGMYLRRDEDVLDKRATRLGRAVGLTRVVLGRGGFHSLGVAHPRGACAPRLFDSSGSHDVELFALHWRMVRNKLESFQFMGSSQRNRNLLDGLRSLALLYPLVRRGREVSALATKVGMRSAPMMSITPSRRSNTHSDGATCSTRGWARRLERMLTDATTFARLAVTV